MNTTDQVSLSVIHNRQNYLDFKRSRVEKEPRTTYQYEDAYIFSIYLTLPAALGPVNYSATIRTECQK
jgi:hypothetical protein